MRVYRCLVHLETAENGWWHRRRLTGSTRIVGVRGLVQSGSEGSRLIGRCVQDAVCSHLFTIFIQYRQISQVLRNLTFAELYTSPCVPASAPTSPLQIPPAQKHHGFFPQSPC